MPAGRAPLATVLRSERILTATGVVCGEVRIVSGRIEAVVARPAGRGGEPTVHEAHGPRGDATVDELPGPRGDAIDLGRRWIVPGFIDTHVHGGGGAQLHSSDPDELAVACRFHAAHGTTALLATTVSAPVPELRAILGTIASARSAIGGAAPGAQILGAHLEGPFVSPARPGALDAASFLAPDRTVLRELLDSAKGAVRMVTLAPELPGALGLVDELHARGVIASVGHSDASYEEVAAAAAAGARSATHVFNAMRGLHHRNPGAVGAALDLDALNAELIVDGEHVSAPALRLALRAKGSRGARLITDAVAAAGMRDGTYQLGAASIEVRDGRAALADGTLAGSTMTMDVAVRRAVAELGLGVEQAVALASANPARLLGLADRKGRIAPGMDADLVVLDDELHVCSTLIGGIWALGPPR